jgi:chromosomal replication initiator protein
MSVQEEFFHTFNTLFQMNKQIILASDCAPRDIDNLEERLKSRFSMGLVADIQPPDLELRIAIFKRKAIEFGYDLDMEVLYYLAKNITTNVRQIEGALKKLKANSLITGKQCDYQTAKDVLSEYFAKAKSEESIVDRIFAYAEKRFGVNKEEIVGKKRNAEIIIARHCVAYLMRKTTNLSFKSIAKLLNKDHTTVMNSIDVIEKKIRSEFSFEKEMQSIINELKN